MAELNLGARIDPATGQRTADPLVLPTADLTTHGIIVGMTGSGKTGLGVVLIEECLSAGVPAILIDPKGDLTNLALVFPDLAPVDFQPWVDPAAAQAAGMDVAQYAAQQATAWKDGLTGWGIGPERLAALRNGVDTTVYTPGSRSGVPLNVVGALRRPTGDLETVQDEVTGYVSGLLGLVGIAADPLASREHILLTNLVLSAWQAGTDLDLPTLVGQVPQPPMRKLGVFELDAFFPPADRMALAMRLNALLASPAFAAWAEGDPLDIGALLRTADGRPRCAIITTAHLSDEERQFVTALVLGRVITWMRAQSGTTDLRALIYMDEVAGYVPPTAVPATKPPIMTLMKQARAFGVGMVLSTQNPVDIDYKAISNAGTWMVGRLQTERDRDRLLDGMSAAEGGVDIAAVGERIAGLGKRQFVARRAGKAEPEVFTTRWAMSYLRGPMTREQIATLTASRASAVPVADPTSASPPAVVSAAPASAPVADDATPVMPRVADGVPVRFVDPAAAWLTTVGADPRGARRAAAVVARVRLRYDEPKADLVHDAEYEAVVFPLDAGAGSDAAQAVDHDPRDLLTDAPAGVAYVLPGAPVAETAFWNGLRKGLVDRLVRDMPLQIPANRTLKLYGRPGEDPAAFAARCAQVADEQADQATAALRDKYATRLRRLEEQRAQAADRREVIEAQMHDRRSGDILDVAGSLLGGLLGGRRSTRRMAKDIRGALGGGASAADRRRLDAASDKLVRLDRDLQDLEDELQGEIARIQDRADADAADVTTIPVPLEKTDVTVTDLVLAWVPVP